MFKRKKKEVPHIGAKTFNGKINLIEIANGGKVIHHFTRPQVVEMELSEVEILELIAGLTKVNDAELNGEQIKPLSEIYLNGININQVSTNYIKNEIIVVENLDCDGENSSAELNVLISGSDLVSDKEKIKLNQIYNSNPSVVIFKNFKTDLPEKKYEQLKNVLLDLFCDAIILFLTEK